MSVIVKGMEMPKNCEECRLMVDFWCYAKTTNGQPGPMITDHRPYGCPLEELPEKHGRLIEADSLKETLDYYIREAGWDAKTNRVLGWVKDDFIDSEPTIVEAGGDER